MVGEKWLALPEGTKVRMTSDYLNFKKWDIVTRVCQINDDERGVRFDSDDDWHSLSDEQWELIEGPKEEPRLPRQGDKIRCKTKQEKEWSDPVYIFICFYQWKALVQGVDLWFWLFEYWSFPPQEEVTLSDGKTYLVEERDWEKILKLKN